MKKKIICFDLDGVICKTKKNNYIKAEPIKKNINKINELFEKGYFIKIFTARYMGRNNDNIIMAKRSAKKLTINQLKKWKVKFHKLYFGKPSSDLYIDDKNLNYKSNWIKDLKKII